MSSTARAFAAARLTLSCSRTTSATCQPTLYIGLSAVIGSWKTIVMRLPRSGRSSLRGRPTSS